MTQNAVIVGFITLMILKCKAHNRLFHEKFPVPRVL